MGKSCSRPLQTPPDPKTSFNMLFRSLSHQPWWKSQKPLILSPLTLQIFYIRSYPSAPRESMRIFSGWVIVCGSCRTFVVCCRKGCPRLCTKFQVSSSTRTVRTSPCPGCPLLSQLELLPQHSAAPRHRTYGILCIQPTRSRYTALW